MDYLHVQADNPWYNYYVSPINCEFQGKQVKNKMFGQHTKFGVQIPLVFAARVHKERIHSNEVISGHLHIFAPVQKVNIAII